ADIHLSSLDGTNGFKIVGPQDTEMGVSVASAGDINGDGFADIILGAPHLTSQIDASDVGAAYVLFGKASGFTASFDVTTLDGDKGFKLTGEHDNDRIGWSVASAGDINGDGFSDMIIGSQYPNSRAGESYVVYGVAPDTAVTIDGTRASQTLAGG